MIGKFLCIQIPLMWRLKLTDFKLKSLSRVQLFATPWTVQPTRLLHPWDSPGKSTGVGCHFLLQGIFLGMPKVIHAIRGRNSKSPDTGFCVSCLLSLDDSNTSKEELYIPFSASHICYKNKATND